MHIDASRSSRYSTLLFKALLKRIDVDAITCIGPLSLTNSNFHFDTEKLQRYKDYFGFSKGSVPLPFLFVATQNEQLQLFTHPNTSIRPLGLVHTYIEFEQFDALDGEQSYEFQLELQAERKTDRGLSFELHGAFYRSGQMIARYRSGYLMPTKRKNVRSKNTPPMLSTPLPELSTFTVIVSQAREYAKLSGDYNPIHLARWSARLFGFNRPIIHGMYMVAKLLTTGADSTALRNVGFAFKKPILMPTEVQVVQDKEQILCINSEGKCFIEMVLNKTCK
ncbi:MaoC like domain protein [Vibrio mediterranei]|uniref:MaoC family dehydratase n=1 Tax=Vibrio mediterranei TaxID=689 RepID=UPI0007825DE6|nr:MaoC/PaaZ C-terminal domain-containing protein [Vibrio mediterranei]SBO11057.1 MaoC like domain protein [Vibrio mediterranei]